MEKNETILAIVKEKGPILPVKVSKEINENILMTSARLSELLTDKQIKISNIKVGGSPLYYYSGQESKLQNFSDNLQEIERKAYNLLEEKKILSDKIQEPAIRVALRSIKDFAIPLQVTYENKNEIFWKWYMIGNKEAELYIKNILSQKEEILKEKPSERPIERITKKTQSPVRNDTIKWVKKTEDSNQFFKNVYSFFNSNNISVVQKQEMKRNSEIDFIVNLQTKIGDIKYFCKSKNKKKINEADLSSALINAQSKGLPLLFITNGDLTKKTKEMLNNQFKSIIIKYIN